MLRRFFLIMYSLLSLRLLGWFHGMCGCCSPALNSVRADEYRSFVSQSYGLTHPSTPRAFSESPLLPLCWWWWWC